MAYLIDPAKVALAIGARCAGNITSDNEQMLQLLDMLLPRIEDAMNVGYLTYGESTDTFALELPRTGNVKRKAVLRLTNGYVDAATVVITDPNGDPVTDYKLGTILGTVELPSTWLAGEYTVVHSAGFHLPDPLPEVPDPAILTGVPAWIEGLVTVLAVSWFRSLAIAPKAPLGFRFGELMAPLRQEIYTRIYSRYQRPRQDVLFPEYSVRTEPA